MMSAYDLALCENIFLSTYYVCIRMFAIFLDGLKRLDYRTHQWDRRLSEFMIEQRDKNPDRIAILTGEFQ